MKTSLQLELRDEERQLKVARIVQRAAEMTHCTFAAKQEAEEIAHTIASGDREQMWEVLQRYLKEYHDFIIGTSVVTNLTVVSLPLEVAARVTVDFLKSQLCLVKGYVYTRHALRSACRMVFQECLRKLLNVLAKSNLGDRKQIRK
jgi:hypothetical protein